MTTRVLLVCLGNICRSPLAEAALRRAAQTAGVPVEVDSAGTGSWHVGEAPDPRAQAVARSHGLDIAWMTARQVTPADFREFDLILALDRSNLANLRALAPSDATACLGLLLDRVPGRQGDDVHDPYYGDASGFERTWQDVDHAAEALVAALAARPAAGPSA